MFFSITFLITWGISILVLLFPVQMVSIFGPFSEGNPLFFLAIFSPTLTSLLLTGLTEGREGIWKLVRRLGRWRFDVFFYVFVLIVIPALGYLAAVLGGRGSNLDLSYWYLYLPLLFSRVFTDPGPLREEIGWRGFALPRLLRMHSALKTSLTLGLVGGVWYLPAIFIAGTPQEGISILPFLLGAIALSIVSTWLYIKTEGSVLATALLHLTTNFSLNVISAPIWIFVALLTAVSILVILYNGPARFLQRSIRTGWSQFIQSKPLLRNEG